MKAVAAKMLDRRHELLLLCLIAAVLVILRLCFLNEPFERDEGFYSVIGQEILRGGLPYKDAIDMKPPGVFYIYAFAIGVFGKTVQSIRIFTILYSLFTLGSVYWLARYLFGSVAGLIAAALFALHSGAPLLQGSSSNSEVFMILPLMLSACFFVAAARTKRRLFIVCSGFFAGLAMLVKTVALPYLAVTLVCCIFIKRNDSSVKERVLNVLAFLIPGIVIALLTVAYFYANGALAEFIAFNITIPFFYSRGGGIASLPPGLVLKYLLPEFLLPALVAVPTAVWLFYGRKSLNHVFLALLLPASVLGVAMPGKYFPHYFIQLIPFISLLAGIGLAESAGRKKLLFSLSIPLIAAFLYSVYYDYKYYLVLTPEEVSINKYGNVFVDSVYIADYLKTRTTADDYIFQWGFEPELYFLADRRTPVPFISSTIPETLNHPEQAIQQMMSMLNSKKPKYVVIQREWAEFPGLNEVLAMLKENYQFDTTLRYAVIFRRR